jgi:hypothetical protein
MSYFCYPPYNGLKAQIGARPLTPEKCLRFYKKHTFNTFLLHRIKGLYKDDFFKAQAIESEIMVGERKYASGALVAKEVAQIKRAVEALDLTPFKE